MQAQCRCIMATFESTMGLDNIPSSNETQSKCGMYDGMMVGPFYNQTYITHGLGGNMLQLYGFIQWSTQFAFPAAAAWIWQKKSNPSSQQPN